MYSFNPLKSAEYNFLDLEKDFFLHVLSSAEERERVWMELSTYFRNIIKPEDIEKYRYTYWRLYVYYSWRFFNGLGEQELIDYAVIQIPDALKLDFDVMDKLFFYMENVLMTEENIVNFYTRFQKKFLNSEFVVGEAGGKKYTITDLVKKVSLLQSFKDNSLEVANFTILLKKILFPKNVQDSIAQYLEIDEDGTVMNFIDIARLFISIKPEDIWMAEKSYIAENLPYEIGTPISINDVDTYIEKGPLALEYKNKSNEVLQQLTTAQKNIPAVMPDVSSQPELVKPSYSEIYQKIDAVFEKDTDGNYEDLDSVMMALEKAGKKYNDPKIAELYYFDEESGKFKWNI